MDAMCFLLPFIFSLGPLRLAEHSHATVVAEKLGPVSDSHMTGNDQGQTYFTDSPTSRLEGGRRQQGQEL